MPGLLGELRSPLSSCNGPGTQLHLLASPAAIGAQGVAAGRTHGLIAAFQAVASTDGDDQLQGSPVLQRCAPSSPVDEPLQSMLAGSATAVIDQQAGGATPASSPAASAELAPGTSLQLLHKLANPGLSCASSLSLGGGRTPLTPQPCGMAAGTEFETPALASGRAGSTSAPVISAGRSAQPPSSPNPPAKPRGLLGRLLLRGVCAAGLPPAQAQVRPSSRWDEA